MQSRKKGWESVYRELAEWAIADEQDEPAGAGPDEDSAPGDASPEAPRPPPPTPPPTERRRP